MNDRAKKERPVSDYVALALLTNAKREDDWMGNRGTVSDFTGDYDELRQFVEGRCGFKVGNDVLKAALRTIGDCDLIRVSDDQFSGDFYRIRKTGFPGFLQAADEELAEFMKSDGDLAYLEKNKADFRKAFSIVNHELLVDYRDFGDEWLDRALNGLKAHVGDGELTLGAYDELGLEVAPASDRTVSLTDNQSKDLADKASELIEEFQKENSVDGDVGVRAKVIGQLKAGRELLIAGIFSTQAMFFTLLTSLSFLAKRYEKETIGALASVLLAELMKII